MMDHAIMAWFRGWFPTWQMQFRNTNGPEVLLCGLLLIALMGAVVFSPWRRER